MLASETIEGRWYVHSEALKLVVDWEGFTVAQANDSKTARQIVKDHNAAIDIYQAMVTNDLFND